MVYEDKRSVEFFFRQIICNLFTRAAVPACRQAGRNLPACYDCRQAHRADDKIKKADVVKLVYTCVSGTHAARCVGSSPTIGTKFTLN